VLVTGASSLMGHGVVDRLLARGDTVVTLQRHSAGRAPRARLVEVLGDVRDGPLLFDASRDCEAIVHLAAKVGVLGSWEEYRSVNVDGTQRVLDAARVNSVRSVVHVSSPSVAHGGAPIVGEGAAPPITGRRNAFYAESKALAEQRATAAASDRLGVVAIRPHLVWGPGDTQLVGRIVDRARRNRLTLVGGGRALVDTTYVDNAVDALIAGLDAVAPDAPCSGRAYVIANGEPRPIRDLVRGICAAAGLDVTPRNVPARVAYGAGSLLERAWPLLRRDGEPPLTRFLAEQLGTAHWFDPRPARDDLGWTPTVTLDDGLERLARWFADGGGSDR
jgi:nucleoside-diphosphate-sugar epimerase